MKTLICGINYAPELTGIGKYTGEMAEWLAAQGHEVRVVTAPPYYPAWRVEEGYTAARYRREQRNGVDVWRCPLWVPRQPSGLKRILHLTSFALSSLPPIFWQGLRWRPDLVWVVEPPLLCAPAALLAARLAGARAWLHVQDFEVDAAFELGLLPDGPLRRWVEGFERWLIQRFDRVSSISDRMVERLISKGTMPGRRLLFPNWVDTDAVHPLGRESRFRQELGIKADTVVALYSGNMGEKQGLEILIESAKKLADVPEILFVMCGDGAARQRLLKMADGAANIRFLPLQPSERLNELLNLADIHLLPQRGDAADLVMPSKLTGMLASGRPVVATAHAGTQVARVVSQCGLVVAPEDANALAAAVRHLAARPDEREMLGHAARHYAVSHWGRNEVLTRAFQGAT